jgi:predicted metal-dependent hydrolase
MVSLLQETYRELRPRAPLPDFDLRFYPFANINNTIRLSEGRLKLRLSDLLEGAPEPVLKAIAHILIAKIYRKDIDPAHATRYRRYIASRQMQERAQQVRQLRGRKRLESPKGEYYDLESIFDELNLRFFHGLLGRPQLSWSGERARRLLGHYDPAHNVIIVSKVFDHRRVPRYAVEYILYHEMLHLKHPITRGKSGRRMVHSKAFHEDEQLFPQLDEARRFLKTL